MVEATRSGPVRRGKRSINYSQTSSAPEDEGNGGSSSSSSSSRRSRSRTRSRSGSRSSNGSSTSRKASPASRKRQRVVVVVETEPSSDAAQIPRSNTEPQHLLVQLGGALQVGGVKADALAGLDAGFVGDVLGEMAVQWMDVRWRTLGDHGGGRAASRSTRHFINAMVHGGNLGHDAILVVLDVASHRYSGGGGGGGRLADSFRLTYRLDAAQGLWLAQRAWRQRRAAGAAWHKCEYVHVVWVINRFVSWHENPRYLGGGGGMGTRAVTAGTAAVDGEILRMAWEDFMEVVQGICSRKSPQLSERVARDLRAVYRALVGECQRRESWSMGEQLPGWPVSQADHLREAL